MELAFHGLFVYYPLALQFTDPDLKFFGAMNFFQSSKFLIRELLMGVFTHLFLAK